MNQADHLNENAEYKRTCEHNNIYGQGGDWVGCHKCGSLGTISWQIPPRGYEFVESEFTPMGLELRRIKE